MLAPYSKMTKWEQVFELSCDNKPKKSNRAYIRHWTEEEKNIYESLIKHG